MMTGAMTTNAYRFDANLDRIFDEKDTLAGKKLFCLASSGSFSNDNYESFLKNGAFYDIDRGVEPDYALTSPESFYDRVTLTDYINSLP